MTGLAGGRAGFEPGAPVPKGAVFPMPPTPSYCSRFDALGFSNTAASSVGPCAVQLATKAPAQPPILL